MDFNFDPLTFRCYGREEMREMLLNLGKWGVVNPETGRPFTLEETRRLLLGPKAEKRLGVPDLSSPKVIRYYVDRARALKRTGVRAVWYDLFFQMP